MNQSDIRGLVHHWFADGTGKFCPAKKGHAFPDTVISDTVIAERGGPAGMIIKNGYIVAEWGDTKRD